jgi:hypothetical protein
MYAPFSRTCMYVCTELCSMHVCVCVICLLCVCMYLCINMYIYTYIMHVCVEHSLSGPLIVCKIICIIKHICMSTYMLHLPCAETQSPTDSMLVQVQVQVLLNDPVTLTACLYGEIIRLALMKLLYLQSTRHAFWVQFRRIRH